MLFTAALLLAPFLGTFPAAAGERGGFPPGELRRYDGKITIEQFQGDQQLDKSVYPLELVSLAEKRQDAVRLRVVRTVRDKAEEEDEEEDAAQAVLDELLVRGGKLLPAREDHEQETESPRQRLDMLLPLELVPPFPLPAVNGREEREQEIVVLNNAAVKARFKIAHSGRQDGGFIVVRELAGSSGDFEFMENSARLTGWREEFELSPDGAVRTVARKFVLNLTFAEDEGGDVRIVVDSSMAAKDVRQLTAPERELLAAAGRAMEEIHELFTGRKPSATIEPRVNALERRLADSPLSPLAVAARSHLAGYRTTFEVSDSARLLAKILGQPAPDFALEDLEGKKVRFREAIQGKVALLSFWGYG
jgi:hypothetical protein